MDNGLTTPTAETLTVMCSALKEQGSEEAEVGLSTCLQNLASDARTVLFGSALWTDFLQRRAKKREEVVRIASVRAS